jgi:hypothetical protein
MKNTFLILLLCIAFTACNNDKANSTSVEDTNETSQLSNGASITDQAIERTETVDPHAGHDHASPANDKSISNGGNNTSTSKGTESKNATNTGKQTPATQGLLIPDACSFLDVNFVAKTLGVSPNIVDVKDATNPQQGHSKACFFKWDDEALGNAGLMVQVMTNPVYDEFPEWVSSFLTTKKVDGEQDFTTTTELYKYKDWKGLGDEGAYSEELAKYHWRLGNDYLFLLAFNLDVPVAKQNEYAKVIGAKVMESFNTKVKR